MGTDLKQAWSVIETVLSSSQPQAQELPEPCVIHTAVKTLHDQNLSHIITTWFLEVFQQNLHTHVAPKFWAHFETDIPGENVVSAVSVAFAELHSQLAQYTTCFDRLVQIQELLRTDFCDTRPMDDPRQYAQLLLKAIVFPSATRHFHHALLEFYSRAFKAFHSGTGDNEGEEDENELLHCIRCEEDRESCTCAATIQAFHTISTQLREMGLLERLSGEAVSTLIHQRIRHHVEHTCKGNFEANYLGILEQWLENKVVGWLRLLYDTRSADGTDVDDATPTQNSPISAHKDRLYHYMYNVYANTRIQELFNVIIEFPESEPALMDLKICLEKTDLRSQLVTSLRSALETRLLHPGVNTADILTAYISAIRALRGLDPSGVLLELVCEPVRKYLRCRDDTVRCIVSSLTEDSSSELSDELIKGQPLVMDDSYHSDHDGENWEAWEPDPVDADTGKLAASRRSSDIISMLVNIYGSKELFVNEYRTLLADRILTHFHYDTEKEIRYLELLKLRFGEAQLHYCEVMLKDVADSKRINAHITEQRAKKKREQAASKDDGKEVEADEEEDLTQVNSMILSAQFWPTFREEKLQLPDCFQAALDKYTKSYETLKGNRTLNWKTHLGLVKLEIEMKDRKLDLSVSPVHATIIWHFQEKPRWTVEALSSVMQMPTAAIRRKVAFWQSHGILREEGVDTLVLVEEQKGRTHEVVIVDEDEAESAMASASDQREEDLQVLWSYIVGMLTNLESLPLDRIHSMLKMFAMQGPTTSECTISELKAFLDRKVKEQKLLQSGGVYRLPKPGS